MLNQLSLVGRLTADPEVKKLENGSLVSNVVLAVDRDYRNAEGEIETDFIRCTLWGKTAKNTAEYTKKGDIIGISGSLQSNVYEKEGKKQFVLNIKAEHVSFISKAKNRDLAKEPEISPDKAEDYEDRDMF